MHEFLSTLLRGDPRSAPLAPERLDEVTTHTPLEAALAYAALGYPIIPIHAISTAGGCTCVRGRLCTLPGKHRVWFDGTAPTPTRLPATIRAWWSRYPWLNLATPTGERAGFWCVDIDERPASSVLEDLVNRGAIPKPFAVARSGGRGGLHAYVSFDQMAPPASSGHCLAPGGDILNGKPPQGGDRGRFVILPPSRGQKARYRWMT